MASTSTTTASARREPLDHLPPARRAPLAQAAATVPCHPKTLRRMIARGEITGYRLGKKLLLVDLDELEAALRPIPTRGSAA